MDFIILENYYYFFFHKEPGSKIYRVQREVMTFTCDYLTLLLPFSYIILRFLRGRAGFSAGQNGSDAVTLFSSSFTHFFCLVSMSGFIFAGLSWEVDSWVWLGCRMSLLEEAGGSGGLLGLQEADRAVRLTGATLSWGAGFFWCVCSQRFFNTLRFPDRRDRGTLSTDWEGVQVINSCRDQLQTYNEKKKKHILITCGEFQLLLHVLLENKWGLS